MNTTAHNLKNVAVCTAPAYATTAQPGRGMRAQLGMGMIGMLVVMLIGGLLLTCVVKMAPVYLGNWNIQSILGDLESQFEGVGALKKEDIVKKISKRMNVDMVDVITMDDVVVKKESGVYMVTANYEKRVKLIGNVDLVMVFNNNRAEVPTTSN